MSAVVVTDGHKAERGPDAESHHTRSAEHPAHGLPRGRASRRAGLLRGLLRRAGRPEDDRDGVVLLALVEDDPLIDARRPGLLEMKRVRPGVYRDGLTVERRDEKLAVHADLHIHQIGARPALRHEDHARNRLFDLVQPAGAIALHHRRAICPRARPELLARLHEMVRVAQRLATGGRVETGGPVVRESPMTRERGEKGQRDHAHCRLHALP